MTEDPELVRLYSDLALLRVELNKQGVLSAVLDIRLKAVEDDIKLIAATQDTKFVTVSRFQPMEKVLQGMIGLALLSLGGALIALVLK